MTLLQDNIEGSNLCQDRRNFVIYSLIHGVKQTDPDQLNTVKRLIKDVKI